MARAKGLTKKTKSAKPDDYIQLSGYRVVEKPKKVPVADSETVINMMGDGGTITIGTNNSKLITKLLATNKLPDSIMQDGYYSFSFDLADYNFSFLPKKKRKGRTISPEHKAKLIAGKAGK